MERKITGGHGWPFFDGAIHRRLIKMSVIKVMYVMPGKGKVMLGCEGSGLVL